MPFASHHIERYAPPINHCEFCLQLLPNKRYARQHHSATSLHLIPVIFRGEPYFLSTSTTDGHLGSQGHRFHPQLLSPLSPNDQRDIWVACVPCHRRIHDVETMVVQAIDMRPYINFYELGGTISTPEILLTITAALIATGNQLDTEQSFERYMAIYFPDYL